MYFNQLAIDLQNRITVMGSRVRATVDGRNERGAAMAEYGLLLSLIALAAIAMVSAFGEELADLFRDAGDDIRGEGNLPAEGDGS